MRRCVYILFAVNAFAVAALAAWPGVWLEGTLWIRLGLQIVGLSQGLMMIWAAVNVPRRHGDLARQPRGALRLRAGCVGHGVLL